MDSYLYRGELTAKIIAAARFRLPTSRDQMPYSSAARIRSVSHRSEVFHPTIRRENTYRTATSQNTPSPALGVATGQGWRSSTPLPLETSSGTETWPCAINQVPSIFGKQNVTLTHIPLVAVPCFSVPLRRAKACPNATSGRGRHRARAVMDKRLSPSS